MGGKQIRVGFTLAQSVCDCIFTAAVKTENPKSQAPNPKQTSIFKAPIIVAARYGNLVIGISLELGFWRFGV
jgi:hypothetical protein